VISQEPHMIEYSPLLHPAARAAGLRRRGFAAWLAVGGALAVAPASAAAAPGVMLGREAPPDIDPRGFLVSEKLDGVRALWNGQRLHFRSGLPLSAPDWFTARLPQQALDGELWLARGQFERLSGAVRKARPLDAEWRQISYRVFDLPGPGGFAERTARLQALTQALARDHDGPALRAVDQHRLADRAALQAMLQSVLAAGGEGLVLHHADARWQPGRSTALLKLKPLHDAEAVVIGHAPGRGRHQGRLGALQVRSDEGIEFEIGTGLSDAERAAPPPLGTRISYRHRGRTAAGVPRFASYLRLRDGD
jgi:DNA ligase-1